MGLLLQATPKIAWIKFCKQAICAVPNKSFKVTFFEILLLTQPWIGKTCNHMPARAMLNTCGLLHALNIVKSALPFIPDSLIFHAFIFILSNFLFINIVS